jgi:hypothetical protein
MKKKWSSITSKENTKEWIEKILILKKDKKKINSSKHVKNIANLW